MTNSWPGKQHRLWSGQGNNSDQSAYVQRNTDKSAQGNYHQKINKNQDTGTTLTNHDKEATMANEQKKTALAHQEKEVLMINQDRDTTLTNQDKE